MLVPTSTTASILVTRNRLRKSVLFQNEDGTNVVYVKKERGPTLAVSSTDHDHRIGPGSSLSLNSVLDGVEAIQDQWSVVAGAGTPSISVLETEDFIR